MLNFAVKLISDAGFQHEISNVNTAAQQVKFFTYVSYLDWHVCEVCFLHEIDCHSYILVFYSSLKFFHE